MITSFNYNTFFWIAGLFASLIFLYFTPSGVADPHWINGALIISLSFFSFWLWVSRFQRQGNWFHPVIFFSLSYIIVYFQIPYCVANGYYINPRYCPYPDKINICASLAVVGLISFYLGNHCYTFFHKHPTAQKFSVFRTKRLNRVKKILLISNWALFLVFISLAGRQLYSTFTYDGSLSWGGGATYINVILFLMTSFLVAIEAVRIGQVGVKNMKEFFLAYDKSIILFLCISNLPYILSGERGTLIGVACAVVAPYFLFCRPLSFKMFFILILSAATFLTFLGNMRTRNEYMNWGERFDNGLHSVTELSSQPNQWPTIHLAASYRIFNTAVAIVPRFYPPAQGQFLWGNISAIFPFYQKVFPNNSGDYIGHASSFFTNYLRDGDFSAGEGSAALGSIYLDFGALGIFPIMAILGFLLRLITFKVMYVHSTNATLWMFIYSYALFQAIKIPRSDVFFWAQNVVWATILFLIVIKPLMWNNKVFWFVGKTST